ncbi:TonB-dependent receptor domain-containing protein [Novosphingobium piscinae]|uniref:TonB-dependent receptor n=1 Tax=Novosphingobium piscinae TaxID=1507448 RepID=A0A7X1G1J6_9SPHN|nr:TonB-dependent receptor [Novosphingobium piscinae]MBC2670307.1 TonB-dependent receptor [Novosphingobium piscinae]
MILLNAHKRRLFATSLAVLAASLAIAASEASAQAAGSTEAEAAEIIVTGSRVAVAPGAAMPAPTTVLDQSVIRALGIPNVGDALLQLPSLLNSASPTQTFALSPQNIGSRIANLRGLGASRTLVLVDGRRFVPSTSRASVDLALVPSAIIARSEIVTGGASAAYGSDAVAGVINLVTDTNLKGWRGQIQRGIAQAGDNDSFNASLAGGTAFADGRGKVIAAAEYEENGGQGDYYSRDWSATESCQLANFVDPTKPANLIVPGCRTGFLTANGLIVGGPLNDQQFSADGQSLVPFVAGQYRGFFQSGGTGAGENAFFKGPLMAGQYRRYSAYGHAEFVLSDAVQPYIDLSYGSITGRNVGAQGRFSLFTGGGLVLRGDNPFLPASVRAAIGPAGSISIGKALNDLGNSLGRSETSTFRVVGGIKGDLADRWHWNAYFQHGETTYKEQQFNNLIPARLRQAVDAVAGPGGTVICRNQSNGCQPFNPLGYGNFSAAAAAFVTGTSQQDKTIRQDVAAAEVRGDLVRLPGGPLALAAGGEYRKDTFRATADPLSLAGAFYTFNGSNVAGSIAVTEGFAELNAPLLADLPFAKALTLNGAVRRTHYSTSGNVTTWKVGGVWQPASLLRFRATRSRDIRAPNVSELFSPLVNGQISVTDPLNNNRQVLVPTRTGGNPLLRPEIADTTTVGLVLNPVRDLFLSVDYYDISVKGVIATTGATNILLQCQRGSASDCARVTRDSTNAITLISDTFANLNQLQTRGIDFELNYRHQLAGGMLSFKGLATYVDKLATRFVATNSVVDLAGQTGNPNFGAGPGVPHFQLTSYLTWAGKGGTSITVQNRFIGQGRYDVLLIGPDEPGYNVSLPNSSDDNSVPSRFYTNLSITQSIPAFGDGVMELYVVVNNLFNTDPPIAPGASSATNGILFDQVGRAFTAGARFRF